MTWWEISLWSIPASLPALAVWRWRVARAQRRYVEQTMAYRRQKFGGFMRTPGSVTAAPVERPDED